MKSSKLISSSEEELLLSRLNTRHFLMKLLLVTWELLVLRCIALARLMQKEAQKRISMHIESFMTGNYKLTSLHHLWYSLEWKNQQVVHFGYLHLSNCIVSEEVHTHPMEGPWEFLGGIKGKYEDKLAFCGNKGGGVQKLTFHGGGVRIFSGTTQ